MHTGAALALPFTIPNRHNLDDHAAPGHLARHMARHLARPKQESARGLSRHMCHAPLRHLARHTARHLGNRPDLPPDLAPAGARVARPERRIQAIGARVSGGTPTCGRLGDRLRPRRLVASVGFYTPCQDVNIHRVVSRLPMQLAMRRLPRRFIHMTHARGASRAWRGLRRRCPDICEPLLAHALGRASAQTESLSCLPLGVASVDPRVSTLGTFESARSRPVEDDTSVYPPAPIGALPAARPLSPAPQCDPSGNAPNIASPDARGILG